MLIINSFRARNIAEESYDIDSKISTGKHADLFAVIVDIYAHESISGTKHFWMDSWHESKGSTSHCTKLIANIERLIAANLRPVRGLRRIYQRPQTWI